MMKKGNEFDSILDECLERVFKGESVEQCLSDYPSYAATLEPLLRMALDAKAATDIEPRPEFRDRARYQFQNALRDTETETEPEPDTPTIKSWGFFRWQPRWVTAVVIVVALLIAGGGTVVAAGDSLPDEALYQVKLATETVRLAFTPSAMGKAELYVELADKRVEEIIKMADKGKVKQVEQATERLNNQLIAMANLDLPGEGVPMEPEIATFGEAATPSDVEEAAPVPVTETVPAPAAEPVPKPAQKPAPEKTPTPAPVIMEEAPQAQLKQAPPAVAVEKAPVAVAPRAPGSPDGTGPVSDNAVGDEDIKADEQAKLKKILSLKAVENSAALQDILNKVPESVRPALLRAIEVAGEGYDKALKNLE